MATDTNIFTALLGLQAALGDYFRQTGTELMDNIEIDWDFPQRVRLLGQTLPATLQVAIQEHLGQFIT